MAKAGFTHVICALDTPRQAWSMPSGSSKKPFIRNLIPPLPQLARQDVFSEGAVLALNERLSYQDISES